MQYIQAIVMDSTIRSMRDLKKEHIPMLKEIQKQARIAASTKYGVDGNLLRLYVHYQPSYCEPPSSKCDCVDSIDHFHVHIVNIYHENTGGMSVGSAHLLEDIISLVSLMYWDIPGAS